MDCLNSEYIEDHMSTESEISLLKDPEITDLDTPEASYSDNLEVSFSEMHLETDDFHLSNDKFLDPNQSTFIEALCFMLLLFNEGSSAKDIMLLFNENNDFSISFVTQVVGGDFPTVTRDQLNSIQQLEADDQIRLDIAIFKLLLRLNRMGKTLPEIQIELEIHGYYLRTEFIKEMIKYENEWDCRMLLD